jgi:hypothetical protein
MKGNKNTRDIPENWRFVEISSHKMDGVEKIEKNVDVKYAVKNNNGLSCPKTLRHLEMETGNSDK